MSGGSHPQHDGGGGSRDDDAGVLLVSGGEGSAVVDAVEIRLLAAHVLDVGDQLVTVRGMLTAAARRVDDTRALSPATAWPAGTAIDVALGAVEGVRGECSTIREALLAAASVYEDAESGATPRFRAPWPWYRWPIGVPLATLPFLTSWADDASRRNLTPSARTVEHAAHFLGIPTIGRFTQILASLPGGQDAARLVGSGVPTVLTAERASPSASPRSGTVGLTRGIAEAYDAAPAGSAAVEVQRIDHADGSTAWVVSIPGTSTLAAGGSDPRDTRTNVQGFLDIPTSMEALVLLALGRAGVQRGQPVLLAGHSQGGMTAMRLAGDREVRERFTITNVVTFGSPVSHMPNPPDVEVLSVEHPEDPVTGIDGAGPAETANRTVVVRNLGESTAPVDAPHGLVDASAHGIDTAYGETARYIDTSSDDSIADWRDRASLIWAGPGDSVTTTVYEGRRGDPDGR